MTPFLQLLLNRKRNDTSVRYPMDERMPDGSSPLDPAIMSSRGSQPTPSLPVQPVTTIPLRRPQPGIDVSSLGEAPAPNPDALPMVGHVAPTTPVRQQADPYAARIESDRQRVIDAQNKPRSKLKAIGEGLADWAASGVGIPLNHILHPQGTETQQAQRQLATDVGLQKATTENQLQRSDIANANSTIALRSQQIAKIQNEIDNPDTSDADKKELNSIKEGVGAFGTQPATPENDTAYAALRARAAKYGITLPATYGPKPLKPEAGFTLGPGDVRYGPDGKVIVTGPTKPEPTLTPNEQANQAEKERQRAANLNAAKNSLTALIAAEEQARQTKERLSNHLADLKAKGQANDANQKEVDEAQKYYASFGEKKRKAQEDVDKYSTVESPPASSGGAFSRGLKPTSGDTRAGTITKSQQQLWLSHNQGKTLDDMQKLYPNARMQ